VVTFILRLLHPRKRRPRFWLSRSMAGAGMLTRKFPTLAGDRTPAIHSLHWAIPARILPVVVMTLSYVILT
jgi:hypothetical protein